jgi:formamidopyrimidine-DNA glycosylase
MPELPEVQTVVSQLGRKTAGDRIEDFWTDWPKAVRPSLDVFRKAVVGAKILGTRRIGKHVVIDLISPRAPSQPPPRQGGGDMRRSIVIHMKMTGHLLVKTPENRNAEAWKDPFNQFIHHRFVLSDHKTIDFSDMRKFAWMEVAPTLEVEKLSSVRLLGVDAMSPKFTLEKFREILERRRKGLIGPVLLEQNLIAGIGNIYRSEALFEAGILPTRRVSTLSEEERKRLFKGIKKVLRRAIRFRGTSDGDFRDTEGKPGGFQRVMGVYRQTGRPCPKCGTPIERLKLGQRSVFFCRGCQK